ncbi:MAG: hypothetical protein M1835_004947 [Candelina submexicana]|nr:MAG: hypothetical protein M1835_004947 [Candelina submexicana]
MADVRSLLRSERASRRISHPQATYSTTGTLVCLVCHIQLKSESLWDSHLRSAQHAMRLQRIRDGTLGRPPGTPAPTATETSSKKRKADDRDGEEVEGRKKTKGVGKANGLPAGFFDEGPDGANSRHDEAEVAKPEEPTQDEAIERTADTVAPQLQAERSSAPALPPDFFDSSSAPLPTVPKSPPLNPTPIDESEWAAFERDIASPAPASPTIPSALHASATISAAPLSAAELAARSAEEANLQKKDRKAAEIEAEKEDAARQLDEEFDEMEELENRVRRLREKREALRRRKGESEGAGEGVGGDERGEEERGEEPSAMLISMNGVNGTGHGENESSDSEDAEDDEDWDGWMGGAR